MKSSDQAMRRTTARCAFFLLFLSCAARSHAQAAASPSQALGELRSAWLHALGQQDLEGSLALFRPDAIFLTPEGARYDDRAAIRTLYRSVIAKYRSRISMASKREEISDQLCVDEGTYSETLTDLATNKPVLLTGSYILVAKRGVDGTWKIAEMVWTGGLGGPR